MPQSSIAKSTFDSVCDFVRKRWCQVRVDHFLYAVDNSGDFAHCRAGESLGFFVHVLSFDPEDRWASRLHDRLVSAQGIQQLISVAVDVSVGWAVDESLECCSVRIGIRPVRGFTLEFFDAVPVVEMLTNLLCDDDDIWRSTAT